MARTVKRVKRPDDNEENPITLKYSPYIFFNF